MTSQPTTYVSEQWLKLNQRMRDEREFLIDRRAQLNRLKGNQRQRENLLKTRKQNSRKVL